MAGFHRLYKIFFSEIFFCLKGVRLGNLHAPKVGIYLNFVNLLLIQQ